MDKATAQSLAQPPPGVERGIWLYELCRFLTQKANLMAIGLFADEPPCSASTCPEMRASEWQYLCAAHEPPKSCCAIDYCCHTLDWCATTLTSTKLFPSRLGLGTEQATAQQQTRKMTEIFRRVYRIFAHAWFSHRDVFWRVESKTGLYLLFKTVCDEYRLIPEDNYTIPPEAEGIENTPTATRPTPTILQRDGPEGEPVGNVTLATGNTTKRHRHTMSHDRNVSVSTVIHEEVEEDDDDGEQPISDSPSGAPELTRIETARHDEAPTDQEHDIPAEDPPPYPEDTSTDDPEMDLTDPESSTDADVSTEEEPVAEPSEETDTKQDEHLPNDPPSYAEIASSSQSEEESSTEASPAATEEATSTSSTADEPVEDEPEEATDDATTKEPEPESKSEDAEAASKESVVAEEDETAAEPMEPTEAEAADETEAPRTVAD